MTTDMDAQTEEIAIEVVHELADVLRDIDPEELRTPLLARIGATGFVTKDILKRMYARLVRERVDATSLLVDLGCGRAGASLLFAQKLGARLQGVDVDPEAIDEARAMAPTFVLQREAQFDFGAFEATWIEPGSAHAVMSIDALHLAPRPLEALAEVYRILISGGVLLFNVYVPDTDPDAEKWVQALEQSGFTTLDIDDQTATWRDLMTRRHRARIDHAPYLVRSFGDRAAAELATSRALLGLDYGPSVIDSTRRIELFARKLDNHVPRRRLAQGSQVQTLFNGPVKDEN
jgi:ubiquinone/menaquinone biosynthesis C-methylase UbiE